jgi:hypothetical protein
MVQGALCLALLSSVIFIALTFWGLGDNLQRFEEVPRFAVSASITVPHYFETPLRFSESMEKVRYITQPITIAYKELDATAPEPIILTPINEGTKAIETVEVQQFGGDEPCLQIGYAPGWGGY